MAKRVRETVIIVPDDTDEPIGLTTSNAKWIRRMEKLESAGHGAEEVESSVSGAREWELQRDLIRLPFHRNPRTWTDEQKEVARERLVGVRAAVAARRAEEAEEEEEEAPRPKRKTRVKKKAAPPPEQEEEEFEDDEEGEGDDEEFEDDDDGGEEEEVAVKQRKGRKARRRRGK